VAPSPVPHRWSGLAPLAGKSRRLALLSALLAAILAPDLTAGARAADGPAPARRVFAAKAPSGFEELLRPQTNVVDIFHGGRRVGEALATFEPGSLRFADARAVVKLIPGIAAPGKVIAALATPLPSHGELVCAEREPEHCGHLAPDVAGIIFDESRFRAEVFVNPAYLKPAEQAAAKYLPAPASGLSLADTVGGAISGSDSGATSYSIQNRALLGYGAGRLAAEFSQSSDLGFQTDTFAASIDRQAMRAVAGLFWTHDRDFFGQSRIYGVSIGTQSDTRADREQAMGSTLTIFLARRSQVEILRDGRLLASKFYDSGNQALDTSVLPDGSYSVTLRIREVGGATREEQQFFVKSRSIPLEGQPEFFVDGGVLARDMSGPLPSALPSFFVEAGSALRLSGDWAVDAIATGARTGASLELGNSYFTDSLRTHAALFAATRASYGALVTAEVHILPTLFFFANARKTWGREHPAGSQQSQDFSFEDVDLTTANQLTGNSTQASGDLNWVIVNAQIGMKATYLDSTFAPRTFSFGPTIDWPFFNGDDLTMTLSASYAQSNYGPHAFVGLRLQFNGDGYAVIGQAGGESARDGSGSRQSGFVGGLSGIATVPEVLSSELTASAGFARTLGGDTEALEGQLRGPYGMYMAETEHESGAGTRYSGSFVTGAAVTPDAAALGGADATESGIVVRLDGRASNAEFQVLVNGSPVGRIRTGQSLPLFLPPYKVYSVRIVPVNAPSIEFDTGERTVSLFPGNVEPLVWDVEPVIDIFGRALREDGRAVADARIEGARSPGMTDDTGYFQLEIAEHATLTFKSQTDADCVVHLGDIAAKNSYAGVGALVCKTETSLRLSQENGK
jgi:Mat/Ecp fimbriae outer membrane usher protein